MRLQFFPYVKLSSIRRRIEALMSLPLRSKITLVPLLLYCILFAIGFRFRDRILPLMVYHKYSGKLRFYLRLRDSDTLSEELLFGFYYHFYKPSPEDEVIDVGANIGDFCIPLSQLVKNIYAFEPSSQTFSILKMNWQANRAFNVHVFNVALGNYSGYAKLETTSASSGGYKLASVGERVRIMKLDDIPWSSSQLIDLLKIDTEGSPHFVLEGGEEVLSRTRRALIEVHTETEKKEVTRILQEKGFKIRIYEDPYGYPTFLIAINRALCQIN
jgi:FkbM family methyltransferase